MALTISNVTVDCLQPGLLAEFWASALAYENEGGAEDWASLRDPEGKGISIYFQRVEGSKTGKNRVHLDLVSADVDAEAARLAALGALRGRDYRPEGGNWLVMQDPEGNEFCIVRSG